MPEKVIPKKKKKELNFRDITTCDATIQMLEKAKRDGVETAWDRAASMKACPIGADSACCKRSRLMFARGDTHLDHKVHGFVVTAFTIELNIFILNYLAQLLNIVVDIFNLSMLFSGRLP